MSWEGKRGARTDTAMPVELWPVFHAPRTCTDQAKSVQNRVLCTRADLGNLRIDTDSKMYMVLLMHRIKLARILARNIA